MTEDRSSTGRGHAAAPKGAIECDSAVAMPWDLRITYLALDDADWLPVLLGFDRTTKGLVVARILDRGVDVATVLHEAVATLGAPRRVSSDAGPELTAYRALIIASLAGRGVDSGDAASMNLDDGEWVSAVVEALQERLASRGPGNRLRLQAFLRDALLHDGQSDTDRGAAAHWYRFHWDGADGDEADHGPCTVYLETTAGGRFLRELRICDGGTVLRHDFRRLSDRDEWRRPDPARHDDIAGSTIGRAEFEDAWNRIAPSVNTIEPHAKEGS